MICAVFSVDFGPCASSSQLRCSASPGTPNGTQRPWSGWIAATERGSPNPKIDSCHTVWMELHDDLLATLGLERGS